MSGPTPKQFIESAKAAQAFADYVSLGPGRSLAKLCDKYRAQSEIKAGTLPPTSRLATLAEWSTKFRWQERLQSAITDKVEASLRDAAEIDAQSFLITSVKLRGALAETLKPSEVIQIRESIRKPSPKGSTSVDVGITIDLSVQQQQILQRVAERRGTTIEQLLDRANSLVQESC